MIDYGLEDVLGFNPLVAIIVVLAIFAVSAVLGVLLFRFMKKKQRSYDQEKAEYLAKKIAAEQKKNK